MKSAGVKDMVHLKNYLNPLCDKSMTKLDECHERVVDLVYIKPLQKGNLLWHPVMYTYAFGHLNVLLFVDDL